MDCMCRADDLPMNIFVGGYAKMKRDDDIRFESIREVVARPKPATTQLLTVDNSSVRARFAGSSVQCQGGGERKSGDSCMGCRRFVRLVPRKDKVAVQCRWTNKDRVEDVMTLANVLITVPSTTRVRRAKAVMRQTGLSHLLVVDRYQLTGVLSRGDIAPKAVRGESISLRVTRSPWIIGADDTVGEARAVMAARDIGCLPVVREGRVRGVITRADLNRLGMDDRAVVSSA